MVKFGRWVDKFGAVWKARVPGRHGKPYTPWPDRSAFEIRVNGVTRADHDELERRIRKVVDDFVAECPDEERNPA